MLFELMDKIKDNLDKYIPKYEIISHDIDKNDIYPCFKINIIAMDTLRITEKIIQYNYSLSINFYPNLGVDNTLLLLSIGNKLNEIFSFEFEGWYIKNKEVIYNEDFVTCIVDYSTTRVYKSETELKELSKGNVLENELTINKKSLINEKEYEIIEKIENKEEY